MNRDIDDIRKQHEEGYKHALIETIKNNTRVLVKEDIKTLLSEPPLESMDLLKSKFIDLAKKNKIVINSDKLSFILKKYRSNMLGCCDEIMNIRLDYLSSKVENTIFEKNSDVIKINKKDFVDINKKIKKIIKNYMNEMYSTIIEGKINDVFSDKVEKEVKDKIVTSYSKYIKGAYQKQMIDNIDIKILIKDTTLINLSKEHSERYLFTINNSRLLNDVK